MPERRSTQKKLDTYFAWKCRHRMSLKGLKSKLLVPALWQSVTQAFECERATVCAHPHRHPICYNCIPLKYDSGLYLLTHYCGQESRIQGELKLSYFLKIFNQLLISLLAVSSVGI